MKIRTAAVKMWFNKKKEPEIELPVTRVDYPYGTCVETEAGTYLIRNGYRLRMFSERVVDSWALRVVLSTEHAIRHLEVKGILGFRDGTLIKDVSDGSVYLIAHNQRRHVTTPDIEVYGMYLDEAFFVSKEEAELHPKGDDLK
jgi:hypothetical protein